MFNKGAAAKKPPPSTGVQLGQGGPAPNNLKASQNGAEQGKPKKSLKDKFFGTLSKKDKPVHPSQEAVNSGESLAAPGEVPSRLSTSSAGLPNQTSSSSAPSSPTPPNDTAAPQPPASAPAPADSSTPSPDTTTTPTPPQNEQATPPNEQSTQGATTGENPTNSGGQQQQQQNPGQRPLISSADQPARFIPQQRYYPPQQQQQQQQMYGYPPPQQPQQSGPYGGGSYGYPAPAYGQGSYPSPYGGPPAPMYGRGGGPPPMGAHMYSPQMHHSPSPPGYHAPQQQGLHIADQLQNLELQKHQYFSSVAPPHIGGAGGGGQLQHPQPQMGAPPPHSPQMQHHQHQQQSSSASTPPPESDEWEVDYSELEITKEIARGSFGVVFQGNFRGTEVAVKKLLQQNLNAEQEKEFASEIAIMKKLHHPNVVLLIGVCSTPPNRCIVTEFCTGSMWNLLHDKSVHVDAKLQYKLILDTTKGMNYLHLFKPPVLHRDMKSANLLVDQNFNVKIADFGLARMKASLMTGNLGTCQYMAPEVIQSKEYSEKADVYSFALVMWEVLTRQVPYHGMQPMQIAFGVVHQNLRPPIPAQAPPSLVNIMTMCWHPDAAQRPPFGEVLKMLKALKF